MTSILEEHSVAGTINPGNAPVIDIESKKEFAALVTNCKGRSQLVNKSNGKRERYQFVHNGAVYQYAHSTE